MQTGTGIAASRLIACALALLVMVGERSAAATLVTNVNITGIDSWDPKGAPGNPVLHVNFPPATIITGIGWNVTQTAYAPSWLSEMAIQFADTAHTQSFNLTPGAGSNFSGQASFSSGGVIALGTLGIPNLLLANGILRLEFHDTFDDFPGAADGVWSGTVLTTGDLTSMLTIAYIPAPSAAAAFGLLAFARRRRS